MTFMKKQYIIPSLRYAELGQKDGLMDNWSNQQIDPSDPNEPIYQLPSDNTPSPGTDINDVKGAWGDDW